jgi:hypothetical protein
MAVTARAVVVPVVCVVVVRRLSRFIVAAVITVTFIIIMPTVVMPFVITVVMTFMIVGFRHVLLGLFIEGNLAARGAEVIGRAFVFALPTRRVVGVHIHLADRVDRCSHAHILQVM